MCNPIIFDFLRFIIAFCFIPYLASYKYELSLGDRYRKLNDLSYREVIITLMTPTFRNLVSGPLSSYPSQDSDYNLDPDFENDAQQITSDFNTFQRNYSVLVMFSMANRDKCPVCRLVLDEYITLSNSLRLSIATSLSPNPTLLTNGQNTLFLCLLNFEDGQEIFDDFQITSIPMFYLFPPSTANMKSFLHHKGSPSSYDNVNARLLPSPSADGGDRHYPIPYIIYDIQKEGMSAEKLAEFLYKNLGIQINIIRQPSHSGFIAMVLLAFLIGGLLYLRRSNLSFLFQPTLWGTIALFFIFVMISGQMWNHIRGPPFMHRNTRTGSVNYIKHDGRSQFIVESYIVFIMYAVLTFGIILIYEANNYLTADSDQNFTNTTLHNFDDNYKKTGDDLTNSKKELLYSNTSPGDKNNLNNFNSTEISTSSSSEMDETHKERFQNTNNVICDDNMNNNNAVLSKYSKVSNNKSMASISHHRYNTTNYVGNKDTSSVNEPYDSNKRRVMAIAGLLLFTIFFSLILSIFRSKYQGYPYSFLFK